MTNTNSNPQYQSNLKVAVICGGPSGERGISLNSARSVCDHLESDQVEVLPLYFDLQLRAYQLSKAQLYSNTPSDFDFKLQQLARSLSESELTTILQSVDIAFPAIHGQFGEDGGLQQLLENLNCPFVGSAAASCQKAFHKFKARQIMAATGYHTIPSVLLHKEDNAVVDKITQFFKRSVTDRAIVKPARGGSSIGVTVVSSESEALSAMQKVHQDIDSEAILEPFCNGVEFSVLILQNPGGQAVALAPAEVEIDYSASGIFDYRKKYLATGQVSYYCPPRFSQEIVEQIRNQAEAIFSLFNMSDFARIDGWLLDDGSVLFTDINPISGMEQNSFLFIEAAQSGMTHRDTLQYILKNSCHRQNIGCPEFSRDSQSCKERVNVIFGGATAERHVSIMSGTNVWLKLLNSERFQPYPYLLDTDDQTVWQLPYSLCLYHTVEEISAKCKAMIPQESSFSQELRTDIRSRLFASKDLSHDISEIPQRMTLAQFIAESPSVFIALHGGIGENGDLQKMLDEARVPYAGSGAAASRLCMNKYETGLVLQGLSGHGIHVAKKYLLKLDRLRGLSKPQLDQLWNEIQKHLDASEIIAKPVDDGCSAGVVKVSSAVELKLYVDLLESLVERIAANTFTAQDNIVEMPTQKQHQILLEKFISTCSVRVNGHNIEWNAETGDWVEVTIGVLGSKGNLKVLNPSLTVAQSQVLSLEEKFQGGTGINITPPPPEFIKSQLLEPIKQRIKLIAETLGISGFARIDCFLNYKTGELIVIEANTIPALTPSTVLYHQGLAEPEPLYPTALLEHILDHKNTFVQGVALETAITELPISTANSYAF